MTLRQVEYRDTTMRYLTRSEVTECCAQLDLAGIVEDTLRRHALGEVLLPPEAYLAWTTGDGRPARSLAMHGGVRYDTGTALGLKLMNASLANPERGMARAEGLVVLFDPETARPTTLMEAAYISALRTAAVTAVTAARLAVGDLNRLAVIGCGTLARAHLWLLPRVLPGLSTVSLHDSDPQRRRQLADELRADPTLCLDVVEATDERDCVRGAGLVVTVTTTTEPYLRSEYLETGTLLAHVSLDDVFPDVVERADLVLVDDWGLVAHDDRRLLGRLYRQGLLRAPDGGHCPDVSPAPRARRVDGTIGDVLIGRHPGRRTAQDVVLTNPFGMAVLDVAVAHAVQDVAGRHSLGMLLPT